MRQYLPYLFSFRRLFQLACISGFPLFMLFLMTQGSHDSLPLFDDAFTGETLIVCAIGYLIISLLFYTTRPHLFLIFFTIGKACLLGGLAAYYYLWQYAPYPPEWID